MGTKNDFLIDIDEDSRATFINQKDKVFWKEWKLVKDCSEEELAKVNLATPHPKYIVLDKDYGDQLIDIDEEYEKMKQRLLFHNIKNWIADRSRNGLHFFIETSNLHEVEDEEVQKEIRQIYIDEFECDSSKKSVQTVISLPNRPHFKTGEVYGVIETYNEEVYTIKDNLIKIAKERVENNNKVLQKIEKDKDFEHYFTKDAFFLYIKNNIIPDGTNRDFTIFPNLAIACVKSGKSDEEIEKIVRPIIEKNFPGKVYAEFKGWLRKARAGDITTYNFYQLNNWMKSYSKKKVEIYNMNVSLEDSLEDKLESEKENGEIKDIKKFNFYWDTEIDAIGDSKIEWLVEDWIPRGDINFIVGKSGSYKTTIAKHIAYAIATGKLVFNKYETIKSNVLYMNEENPAHIFLDMRGRVKNGLDINEETFANIGFTMLGNVRMDDTVHLLFLIDFIKRNKIEVLFLDSFRRFMSFDENNATEMNKLFNNWKIFRKECNNLTIISIHHLKKGGNDKYQVDSRDMLRGSSDIVNNADSIIAVDRKKGSRYIKVSHIKNRSGEEENGKLIVLDAGDKKDKAYFYESEKELDSLGVAVSATDKCANSLTKWFEDDNITTFKRGEIKEEIKESFSHDTISKTLREMISDGVLTRQGSTRSSIYLVNGLTEKKTVLDGGDNEKETQNVLD